MKSMYSAFSFIKIMLVLFILSSCNNHTDNSESIYNKTFSDAPGSYKLKPGSSKIIIPFEMFTGNKPMIKGEINGKKVKLLIDNGKLFNEIWFYNGETDSIDLHFKTKEADSIKGIGQKNANQIFEGNSVTLDFTNIQFINQPTLISPSNAGYADFFPGINGQVSAMLFKHFIVKFDFENHILILNEPDKFVCTEKMNVVKMHKRDNGSYCIPFQFTVSTGKQYEVLLDIDIGTVFPLYLISTQKNKIQISKHSEKKFLGLGASGELYGYADTLKELKFAGYLFEKYPTLIAEAESNADTSLVEAGTFGIPLLRQFNVTFDYFNELLFFEPNKNFKGKISD